MAGKNHLYKLIPLIEGLRSGFVCKTNLTSKKYFLHDFGAVNQEVIDKYVLVSHHASVYENLDEYDGLISDIHYTAFFSDQDANIYQLHAYFSRSTYEISLVFSKRVDVGAFEKMDISANLMEGLEQLVFEYAVKFVREVREACYLEKVKLEKQYAEAEKKLSTLSADFAANRDDYIDLVKYVIPVLDKLGGCFDVTYAHHHAKVLLSICAKLRSTSQSRITLIDDESADSQNINDYIGDDFSLESTITATTTVRSPQIKKNMIAEYQDKLREVNAASLAYDRCKKDQDAPYNKKLQLFLAFHYEMSDLLTQFDRALVDAAGVDDLQQVQALLMKCHKDAKDLLGRLLLQNELRLAESMTPFISLIPDTFVIMALKNANTALLEFLLTYGNYAIDLLEVSDHLTAVKYCYVNHSPSKNLVGCLKVLIKHGASVWEKLPDGLPIAHQVCKDSTHPLYPAFLENSAITIGTKKFYKRLIQELNVFLKATPELDDKLTVLLRNYITQYEKAISDLSVVSAMSSSTTSTTNFIARFSAHQANLNQKYSDIKVVQQLKNNPELNEKVIFLNQQVELLFAKHHVSYLQKHRMMSLSLKKFKNTEDFIDSIRLKELPSKIDLAKYCFDFIDNITELVLLLNNVDPALLTPGHKSKNQRKQFHALQEKILALDKERNDIFSSIPSSNPLPEFLATLRANVTAMTQLHQDIRNIVAEMEADDDSEDRAGLSELFGKFNNIFSQSLQQMAELPRLELPIQQQEQQPRLK